MICHSRWFLFGVITTVLSLMVIPGLSLIWNGVSGYRFLFRRQSVVAEDISSTLGSVMVVAILVLIAAPDTQWIQPVVTILTIGLLIGSLIHAWDSFQARKLAPPHNFTRGKTR